MPACILFCKGTTEFQKKAMTFKSNQADVEKIKKLLQAIYQMI
ncbi:MAG: hypothetical protein RIS64_180 [Bacteroidota bacterium]|jgi:hypothetical protein